MSEPRWLRALEVGSKVVVDDGVDPRVTHVVRLSKTMVVVSNGRGGEMRFNRHDLRPRGWRLDMADRAPRLAEATPGAVARANHGSVVFRLRHACERVERRAEAGNPPPLGLHSKTVEVVEALEELLGLWGSA